MHVHVRDADGRETLAPEALACVLTSWRARCPDVAIGVTTGIWIAPDPKERSRLVAAWRGPAAPDFASVNLHEEGALELAQQLQAQGIGVEAGLAHAAAAERWLTHPAPDSALRILLEPAADTIEQALVQVADMEAVLQGIPRHVPRLLHGHDATAWALLRLAAERGYDARIGFEDVLTLPDGAPAESNAQLVRAALDILQATAPSAR